MARAGQRRRRRRAAVRRLRVFLSGLSYGFLAACLAACVIVSVSSYRKWQGEVLARGQPSAGVHSFGLDDQLFIDSWLPLPRGDLSPVGLDGGQAPEEEMARIRDNGVSFTGSGVEAWVTRDGLAMSPGAVSNAARPPGWEAVYQGSGSKVFTRASLLPQRLCPSGYGSAQALITGTRSLDAGIQAVCDSLWDYVYRTGQPAAWKVSVVQGEGDVLPSAVVVLAQSLDGEFFVNRLIYNAEPGYEVDYRAGYSAAQE